MGWAATLLVTFLAACTDVIAPGGRTLSTAELLILAQQSGAPTPSTVSFWVFNERAVARVLSHADPTLTPYGETDFPAGSLASLNGQALGPEDSVFVTVSPRTGGYGMTIEPVGVTFTNGFRPTIGLFFARYGDFSVADGSPTYASREAYARALDIWQRVGVDLWSEAPNSRATGSDEVSASPEAAGEFVLAAPR